MTVWRTSFQLALLNIFREACHRWTIIRLPMEILQKHGLRSLASSATPHFLGLKSVLLDCCAGNSSCKGQSEDVCTRVLVNP